MSNNKIAILGCGPAGLMAAQACLLAGRPYEIISLEKSKSFIAGAQYLHSFVPGIGLGSGEDLSYIRLGTAEGYCQKVYNSKISLYDTSWYRFPDHVQAWPLRDAYDHLWKIHEPFIREMKVDWAVVPELLMHYQAVFSTVPLPSLLVPTQKDRFKFQDVWISEPLDHLRTYYNEIVYSGRPEDAWYRKSNVFGHESVEFSREPEGMIARKFRKPVGYSGQEPWPEVHKFGRYGKWDKKQLVDDAFKDAWLLLS